MFYPFVRLLLILTLKIPFRYKITGSDNLPKDGPVLIAANHRSYLDPIFLAIAIKREINFMGKDSLFKYPVFGTLIKMLNTFPVKKGVADKAALIKSLNILENGDVLLIFPEGTRYRDGGMGPPHPGATAIALKTGAPILPVGITGAEKILPDGAKLPCLPKIKINVGRPIQVEKLSGAERKTKEEKLTEHMMTEISRLIEDGK